MACRKNMTIITLYMKYVIYPYRSPCHVCFHTDVSNDGKVVDRRGNCSAETAALRTVALQRLYTFL